MKETGQQKKLKFQIDPQTEGGVFSNVATVFHSETEFLVDFGMFLPGKDTVRVGTRVILAPRTAKQLLMALTQNIRNYEQKFGEITMPKSPMNFPGNAPEIAQ